MSCTVWLHSNRGTDEREDGTVAMKAVMNARLTPDSPITATIAMCVHAPRRLRQLHSVGYVSHPAIVQEVWQFLNVRLTAHGFTVRRTTADGSKIAYIFR